jgi:hypothetical protein
MTRDLIPDSEADGPEDQSASPTLVLRGQKVITNQPPVIVIKDGKIQLATKAPSQRMGLRRPIVKDTK